MGDDGAVHPLTPEELRDFLEILDDRDPVRTTVSASEVPVKCRRTTGMNGFPI